MMELINEADQNKSMLASEKRTLDNKMKDIMQKIKSCGDEVESLMKKIEKVLAVENLTEQDIRKSLSVDSKDWNRKMDQLFETKREIDSRLCYVELTPSNLTLVEQFKSRFNKVIDDTTEKLMHSLPRTQNWVCIH